MNKRYDIDPKLVAEQIEYAIKRYEQMRIQFKNDSKNSSHGSDYVDPMIDSWIDMERNYFSNVRIIRLPKSKNKRKYILVYGDVDDATVTDGTGRFQTIKKAAEWFLNNGR